MKTIKKIEEIINLPVEKWKGKCHEMAMRFISNKLADGDPVYGHWLGPVARTSFFFGFPCVFITNKHSSCIE